MCRLRRSGSPSPGFVDPNEGDQGPWDGEVFPLCHSHVPPAGATVACQPEFGPNTPVHQYQYFTSWSAPASTFVQETCGPVMRFCEGRRSDPNAGGDWPCPCDPTKYRCVAYQLDI